MRKNTNLPAGNFSAWLRQTQDALIKEEAAEVNCGECTACCTSSYLIHIRPEETKTLKHINKKLLFPAPGLPKGNVLLGYFETGHCPMLMNNKCSIYKYRSITCRNYDCRIFNAAGIDPGGKDKALITQRSRQWEFSYPSQLDRDEHVAVQEAAKFIQEHANCFPGGRIPSDPSQLAILAIKVYDVFLDNKIDPGKTQVAIPDMEVAKAIVEANESFEAKRDAQLPLE